MDEKNMPLLIQNRIDIKSITYECLNASIEILKSGEIENISISPKTRVGILTSFGIVQGTPINQVDEKNNSSDKDLFKAFSHTLLNKIFETRNDRIKDFESENPNLKLINDSSAILLEDVIITPFSNPSTKTNLAYFILFTEEIKGLTFGELSATTY